MKRIGLFGGTFNPIHIGHATLAQNVLIDFSLTELVFIPAKLPPHKNAEGTTPQERYEMALLTAKALGKNFSVSDFEINAPGISYTYLTLKHWRKKHPDDILFFICGSDIFITIAKWQKWAELFEMANFIVANRMGVSFDEVLASVPESLLARVIRKEDFNDELHGKIILYTMDPVRVSSTQVRAKMAEEVCSELLPEDVYNYIIRKKLYTNHIGERMELTNNVQKIKDLIDEKLGEDIVCLDLQGISSVTDYLIIASAKADTHVRAISEHLMEEMKKAGNRALAYEGLAGSIWTCVDYGDVIVHVMRKQEREYYNLEGIWGGAPRV